jgi:hypothetical protein
MGQGKGQMLAADSRSWADAEVEIKEQTCIIGARFAMGIAVLLLVNISTSSGYFQCVSSMTFVSSTKRWRIANAVLLEVSW